MGNSKARGITRKLVVLAVALSMVFTMSMPCCAAEKVSKPANVKISSVTALNSDSIQIKWKKSAGAAGYKLYRDGKSVKTFKAKARSYTDENLDENTKYAYQVRAFKKYKSNGKTKYKYGEFGKAKVCTTLKGASSMEFLGSISSIKPLAGKIFMVYDAELERNVEYHFYDADKNEITEWSDAESLSTAVYYSIEGTPKYDHIYVVGRNEAGEPLKGYGFWSSRSEYVEFEQLDTGKSYTGKAIKKYASTSGTIWNWIQSVNEEGWMGYSDWYMGSKWETNNLISSGLAPEFKTTPYSSFWAAEQEERGQGYSYWGGRWAGSNCYNSSNAILIRSF